MSYNVQAHQFAVKMDKFQAAGAPTEPPVTICGDAI